MYLITFVVVIFIVIFHGIKCDCDIKSGPVGSYECVLLEPHYHQYQWAYCKTNTYIQLISKRRHACRDLSATYCYYQCNIEVNNDGGSGEVLPNCLCDPDVVISTPTPLPGECTSPDGTDCNWYIDCLEKRYPCKQSGEISYATDYALKYCNLYTDHYQSFSDTGKQWIDAVRKCLQVQLVSLLNPNAIVTCQGIQERAIASHHGCYFDLGDDAPSFCDIGFADWAKVFWTIKSSFLDTATLVPMLQSMAQLPLECPWQTAEIAVIFVPIFKIRTVFRFVKPLIGKRSVDESSLDEYDRVIQVSDLFSSQMNWEKKGITWFAYPEDDSVQSYNNSYSSMSIVLMLAPQSEYDLNAEPTTVSVNITEAVTDFENSLKHGKISIPSDNGLQITNISFCNDMSCNTTGPDLEIKFSELKSSAASVGFSVVTALLGLMYTFY